MVEPLSPSCSSSSVKAPFPWPCLVCRGVARRELDSFETLDLVYDAAVSSGFSVRVEPCETHGDHVELGPWSVIAVTCPACRTDALLLYREDAGPILEWLPDRKQIQVVNPAVA